MPRLREVLNDAELILRNATDAASFVVFHKLQFPSIPLHSVHPFINAE